MVIFMTEKLEATLPIQVRRSLKKLGADIRDARRRRRIQTMTVAERALISRVTLTKVEKGDPSVGLGIYATVLFVFGITERLSDLTDPKHDTIGLGLEDELCRSASEARTSSRGPADGPRDPCLHRSAW